MICKRCGSECPYRPEGYCFHCLVGLGVGLVNKETNKPIKDVRESFPLKDIDKGIERFFGGKK